MAETAQHPMAEAAPARRAIVHPWVDFLCLGGLTFILFPILLVLPERFRPELIFLAWAVSDLINHPHFAASYQIYYRGFRAKAFGDVLSPGMRLRYQFAGIWAPAALAAYLISGALLANPQMLGWAANLMFFLVGWHYVKQGYGMLIVDSVFQRCFFNETEKTVLRWNAYACWIVYWLAGNWVIDQRDLWGFGYYSLPVPVWVIVCAAVVAGVSTLLSFRIFALRLSQGQGLPLTGVMSYVVTIYIWLIGFHQPMTLLVIPALHSLQYLLIVGRFEANRAKQLGEAGKPGKWPVARFATLAVVLGLSGFWWVPKLLELTVRYDAEVYGGAVFLFMFWVFINIHHYLLDNVMWRRENPEARTYLFGGGGKPG